MITSNMDRISGLVTLSGLHENSIIKITLPLHKKPIFEGLADKDGKVLFDFDLHRNVNLRRIATAVITHEKFEPITLLMEIRRTKLIISGLKQTIKGENKNAS